MGTLGEWVITIQVRAAKLVGRATFLETLPSAFWAHVGYAHTHPEVFRIVLADAGLSGAATVTVTPCLSHPYRLSLVGAGPPSWGTLPSIIRLGGPKRIPYVTCFSLP